MKKITKFIGNILFFVGFLILFIISLNIHNKFSNIDSQFTLLLAKNWLDSPIIDIQTRDNCSSNYNTSEAIFDYWAGTVLGCNCSNTIRFGSCSSKSVGCRTIQSTDMIPYKKWRSSKFCFTRLPMNSYLGLTIASQNESCPFNHKNCGKIDTLENILCMPDTSVCPINDIQMLNSNEIVPPGYKTISLSSYGENKTLAFGNKGPSGKIAVEFKISDNIPCINPLYSNKLYSHILESNYFTDKCFGSLGGTILDKSYQFIDSTTKNNLYSDNNILININNLPSYPVFELQLETRLYYRNFIGINKSCYNSIQAGNLFKKISDGLNVLQKNFSTFKNIYGGIFVYIMVISGITLLLHHLIRGIFCFIAKEFDDHYEEHFGSFCEFFIFICFLPIMILNIIFYTQIKSLSDAYVDFFPYIYCGDNPFNEAVPLFLKNLDNIFTLSFVNLIISIIIFILPLTSVFYTRLISESSMNNLETFQVNNNQLIGPSDKNLSQIHSITHQ